MKIIEKSNWVSANGLWKVSYEVLGEGEALFSNTSVMKSAGENIWKDTFDLKVPKYVEEKQQEATQRIQEIIKMHRCKHEANIELIEIAGTTESIALCSDCKQEI